MRCLGNVFGVVGKSPLRAASRAVSLWAQRFFVFIVITLGVSMNASASTSITWKEELLLHDNSKTIIERTQKFGNRPSLDSNERIVIEERWDFQIPGTNNKISWSTGFANPPEASGLMLMQVNFLDGVPYIASSPAGTLSYNHWGRPNPPYVFFKYDDKDWRRIPLADFPAEFIESNVVVGGRANPEQQAGKTLAIAKVKEANRPLDTYLRQIVRQPITQGDGVWLSPVMVYDGKGTWASPGGFTAPEPPPSRQPATVGR